MTSVHAKKQDRVVYLDRVNITNGLWLENGYLADLDRHRVYLPVAPFYAIYW